MLYYIAWIVLQPVVLIIRLFVKIEGRKNIPRGNGGLIVVANHIGEFDPWKIGPLFPFRKPIYWFAKKELYCVGELYKEYSPRFGFLVWPAAFFIKLVVTYSLTIPVDRESDSSKINRLAIKKAGELLRAGKTLGIFGEGGMYKQGEAHPIFASLAAKYNVPVLPVRIEKGRLVFGQPLSIGDTENSVLAAKKIMDIIYNL